MPATYYIHIGLECKVGDHTTLQAAVPPGLASA